MSVTDPNGAARRPDRRQLRPLLALWPYIWRHRGMVLAALVALVASAAAMLTVPVAVRRMIDHGFSGADGVFIDKYFAMLIVIGLVLAVASAGRMYAVNWLGERVVADLRAQVFRHLADARPRLLRDHAFGRGDEPPHRRHHPDQGRGRLGAEPGAAQSDHAGGRARHDVRDEPDAVGPGAGGDPGDRLPAAGLRPRRARLSRAAQDRLADASAYAADNLGAVRAMVAFGQEAAVVEAASRRRWSAPSRRRARGCWRAPG